MSDQIDFRAALFGHRSRVSTHHNNSTQSLELGSHGSNQQHLKRDAASYEKDNDRLIEELDSKVSILKQVTIDINRETMSSNAMLDDLDSRFDSVGESITAATRKIKNIIQSGGSKYMFHMVIFIFIFFIFMYVFLR